MVAEALGDHDERSRRCGRPNVHYARTMAESRRALEGNALRRFFRYSRIAEQPELDLEKKDRQVFDTAASVG